MIALPEPSDNDHGDGELFVDPHHKRRDLNMILRGLKCRWDIPTSSFRKLPRSILKIALNKNEDTEVRLKAATIILRMEQQNQRDQHEAMAANRHITVHHEVDIEQLSNDQLLAIIEGRFGDVSGGGQGAIEPPAGDGEPA